MLDDKWFDLKQLSKIHCHEIMLSQGLLRVIDDIEQLVASLLLQSEITAEGGLCEQCQSLP
jgi:hypothetical protein